MDKTKIFAAVEKFAAKGQVDKALEQLDAILRSDPNDLKSLNRAADLALKSNMTERTFGYLKRVGQVYTKDGFYSKAVAVYKRILKLDENAPKNTVIEIHEQLASLYGQLGLVSDAMGHFSIVVDYYDSAADNEALLRVLRKVSDLDPYNVDSQLKLAELFKAQKRDPEAKETLQRLDDNIRPRGNAPELVRIYERWVDMYPEDVDRLKALVDICLRANEPKKALARIQACFRADPRNAEVLELLSSTFFALKQPEKARSVDFELVKIYRASGLDEKRVIAEARIQDKPLPSLTGARATMAAKSAMKIEGESGEDVDAGEALIAGMNLGAAEKKTLAECDVYLKYGLAEKAFDVLNQHLGQFPQSLAMRWRLKRAALELNRKEEAIQLLSEVVLLAKTKELLDWTEVAANDLRNLDPHHPSLAGMASAHSAPKKSAVENSEMANESTRRASEEEIYTIDPSDLSDIAIVIEDDFTPIPHKAAPQEDLEPTFVSNAELSDSDSQPFELEMSSGDEPVEAIEPAIAEDGLDSILSEADFSEDELTSLAGALDTKSTSVDLNEISETVQLDAEEERTVADSGYENIDAEDVEFEVRQGLEEIAFFKSQGLSDEAQNLLKSLKQKYPTWTKWDSKAADERVSQLKPVLTAAAPTATLTPTPRPRIADKAVASDPKMDKKTSEVSSLGTKMKFAVQDDLRSEAETDFFDFADELNKEMAAEEADQLVSNSEVPAEVRDVFKAFKKGVSDAVASDDWQTHYDLGVAYREMGLVEDAVEEFTQVSRVVDQRPGALYQIGLCEISRQNFAKAKDCFSEALKATGLKPDEKVSLTYELAEVLLSLNDEKTARKLFAEVQKIDPEYREVTARLQKLA